MDDNVEDTGTDSMDSSVSDFTRHLLMIEQQLNPIPALPMIGRIYR